MIRRIIEFMQLGKRYARFLPWGIYSLLALLILGPLLQRGFVFALDMVFTPTLRMPTAVTSSYILRVLLHYLNFIFPGDVIEKILLFAILLLAGVGMHKLVQGLGVSVQGSRKSQKTRPFPLNAIPLYFAGAIYMINPFTYERLMAGQYNVIFGYALLPWFTKALLVFLQKPALRQAVYVAVWAVAVSIVSIHAVGFMGILVIFAGGLKVWQLRKDTKKLIPFLKLCGISAVIFWVASSYWLAPLALGKGTTADSISNFTTSDQAAFTTTGSGWVGQLGNVLHLQGFWVEDQDTFTKPQAGMEVLWGMLTVLIWILIISGIVKFIWEGNKDYAIIFGGSAFVATILAIGTMNGWLADNIPNFAGYREPQKFVALVALCLIVFAARGAAAVLQYCLEQGGKFFFYFATIILFAIPLIWTHNMLWGFGGQLFATNYPAGWYAVNDKLDADNSNYKTIFLPWHLYMGYIFAGHIIANPAPQFFDKPVIISDNPEFAGIAHANSTPLKQKLDAILPGNHDNEIGKKLGGLGIKYIIFDKDDDYLKYLNLYRQKDLKVVYNSDSITLFENKAFK
ncbi:MAG TPA: hypothetical protein VLG47_07705 [Candidatus Saccharimonadales bacterium]|nr:hypothetical protein [Candidatus Saccharimonadales bacterium]